MKQLSDILFKYSQDKSNLIPILHEVQDNFGYLSEEAIEAIAAELKLSNSTVYSVASFYADFRFTPPAGTSIKVCQGPACYGKGSHHLLDLARERLKMFDAKTPHEYGLETTFCSGACHLAPVVEVNGRVRGQMTEARLDELLPDASKRPRRSKK